MNKLLTLLITLCCLTYFSAFSFVNHELTPVTNILNGTTLSKLNDGSIYKIAVSEAGVYKMSYAFLKDELKIDIDNIDPRNIQILSNGSGKLPELAKAARIDDLEEMAIFIQGEGDGQFNDGDYIIFYSEGPHKWNYNSSTQSFSRENNPYDDFNHLFIKIGNETGKRITNTPSANSGVYQSSEFNDYDRLEEDKVNLLSEASGAQGSGQNWFGELFSATRSKSKSFTFPNLISDQPARLTTAMVLRSGRSSSFTATINGDQIRSSTASNVVLTNIEATFARVASINRTFQPANGDDIEVNINYPAVGDGTNRGWLDYIELNVRRSLTYTGESMTFRDTRTITQPSSTFQLSNANANIQVWDITDVMNPSNQEISNSASTVSFNRNINNSLLHFLAFEADKITRQPEAIGSIENQNLHGIEQTDMLIIYHPDFKEAAERLAQHRRSHSQLNVSLVSIYQVYNEFSGGSMDPTAIRDMARMIKLRTDDFRYLLLFGDGSYDFRNRYNIATEQNQTNFVPVYETNESLHPVESFPADDYFGLLSDNESGELEGAVDIAVGRFTVRTRNEANAVVNKIIRYDTEAGFFRDWRNRLTFVADDEDGNTHINQADNIAVKVANNFEVFNINKIYLDAYEQESTPGGARYPQAQTALNRDIFRGAAVINYLGHGGSKGWSQERVLTIQDILSWKNDNRLPLFVTATCSFTGYDEPTITTAGEETFLNPDGGVIGLFTTTRAVYASSNFRLTSAVFDTIFQMSIDEDEPIGEILRVAKNFNPRDTTLSNARKFTLIGDPAMKLAIPKYEVVTSSINGIDVNTGTTDTLNALSKVTVEGFINDRNGQLKSDFNGTVYPTVFDKEIVVQTLAQDAGSREKQFTVQRNVVFKGKATVTNGRFTFQFIVPQDIDYSFGNGKISYYAENGQEDAAGYFNDVIIGGASENGVVDDQGPLVQVFMDSEDFILGGTTTKDPTLLVKLSDDNGINVAGSSIGHDLSGTLDNNTQNTYVLNDFYEAEENDYTKGTVRFPLFDLEPGEHRIQVKAWDIANNSSEGFTEFIVAESENAALDHVLNYPNPFTTNTQFQFEYNRVNQSIDVQVQIFTISGHLVKTIEDNLFHDGGISKLSWDGRDDYGDKLARGVYVYKVKVRSFDGDTSEGTIESDFEKLVILN